MKAYLMRSGVFLILIFSLYSAQSADYYWVGGSGNWSDLSHWATSSGGGTGHIQVPTVDDNVYFDANSFDNITNVVTLNSDNIFFKNMTWAPSVTGVTLTGDVNVNITVYGGFLLSPSMNYDFRGDVYFSSTEADFQEINTQGFTLGRSVIFDSQEGKWTINNDTSVDSLFRIQDGTLQISPTSSVVASFLEIDVDISGSLILEGNLTITGSDFRYISVDIPTAYIDGNQFVIAPSTASSLIFTGADVTLRIEPFGLDLLFNYLDFTNPEGTATIDVFGAPAITTNRTTFASNGVIRGPMNNMELRLSPAKTYSWEAGINYPIEIIEAIGICAAPITIQSSTPGQAASFSRSDGIGTINGEYLNIKDITISSGTFEVDNSLNLGNTAGWIINERISQDLYWVGGSGNWDDPAHWSTTSGGPGGICIPSIRDNVFFDGNSFSAAGQTCTINIDDAFCLDFNWNTGFVNELLSEQKNLHIGGSLDIQNLMEWNLRGKIFFESTDAVTPEIIRTSGTQLNNQMYLVGTAEWVLQDDLVLDSELYHNLGTFTTNDFNLDMRAYLSMVNTPRTINLGSSTWALRILNGFGAEWRAETDNYIVNAGTSTIQYVDGGSFTNYGNDMVSFNRVLFDYYGSIETYSDDQTVRQHINYCRVNVEAYIYGQHSFGTLELWPGTEIRFPNDLTTNIDTLIALGTCDRPIGIHTFNSSRTSTIETNRINSDITHVFVRDIHVIGTGGGMEATASVDLGNNLGWVFDAEMARTLYWVGEGGEWTDTQHWSLTSGGPGGECVPTPIDDIIFDAASFSSADQRVRGAFTSYFRNLTATDVDEGFKFEMNRVYAYGSVVFSALSEIEYWSELVLSGNKVDNVLDTKGQKFNYLRLDAGDGFWEVIGALEVQYQTSLNVGNIDFGSANFKTEYIILDGVGDLDVDFGNASFEVTGVSQYILPFTSYKSENTIINPGTAQWNFTSSNTGIRVHAIEIPFYNVRFTDPQGLGLVSIAEYSQERNTFNKIQFDGNGTIDGITTIDSLLLAPGKSYRLKSGVSQEVNKHLQVLGNNCSSIELISTQVESVADIDINNFEVVGDFIQMRDIRINNSEPSYAGIHSTDIGNSNIGWIFDDAPSLTSEEVGFFGDDQVLCTGASIQLEAYPFNANATFLWNDGSTNNVLDVATPGEYYARVTFDGSCSIIDTVQIFPQAEFAVILGNDTTLCESETLLLDVSVAGATYKWQDDSEEAIFLVTESGQYNVEVTLAGCAIMDTIDVGYISLSSIELGEDQVICANQETILDATVTGATYLWQDGSATPTYTTDQPGKYWVDVTSDNCTASDTVMIAVTPLANIELGNDTTLCEGLLLDISTSVVADSYSWSDGSTAAATSLPSGKHYLDLTLNGCTATDTIEIVYKPYPTVELGADTTLCSGETLAFNLTGSGDYYLWSDGSNMPDFTINGPGTYNVIIGLNDCLVYDTLGVSFASYPTVDLGVDTILCEGTAIVLGADDPVITSFEWQDGSSLQSLEVNTPGSYFVDVYNATCKATDTINIQFNPRPIFDLGTDRILCLNDALDLDATVSNASYIWSDGSVMATNSYTIEGDHWVDVTVDGCTVRDSVALSYVQIPSASLGRDTILCDGDFLFYDFSSLNLQFEWSDTSTDPTNTLGETGTYWLEVTDRDCRSRDSISILYKPAPTVELGRDTMLCRGDQLLLSLTVANDEMVTWSDNSSGDNLLVTNSGSYSVAVDKNDCIVNDEIIITFNDPPNFDLGMDTLICEQQPLVLEPGISGATYRWQDGSDATSFKVDRPGFYEVEVNKSGCTTIDNIDVDTRTCTFYRAYLPEVFSPNGDGINDTYQPGFPQGLEIVSYKMTIYDRWGSELFVSEDPNLGWDGTFSQNPLNSGTYVYTVAVEYIDDRGAGSKLQRGEFLIIR